MGKLTNIRREAMELKDIFFIKEDDWYRLQAWATIAYDKDKNEISGLMTAVPQKDGRFKIGDVEILKQENTSTNTDLNGDAVSEYMMKYGMKYNNPDMKFVWWHSHHTMGAFWSGTDEREINAWKNNSYSLALVINLKEEYLFRVSFWKTNGLPLEQHIDTTLNIEREVPKVHITDAMEKTYKKLCSSPKIIRNNYISYNNQTNIWAKNENQLVIEKAYSKLTDTVEEMQDSFMDGTLTHKGWKKEVAKINKKCKTLKYPFRLEVHNMNKHELQAILMTKMPSELIEFDDNRIKDELETLEWNRSFGMGGYGWQ
tara:strand:+ start:705 stop:1646 length:942 start_codon:yes stop_codon:yes gene_type:complete